MAEIAKTHWIWVPAWKEEINGKPRLVRFRKVFKMTREEILQYECLKLKISADTRYKLYPEIPLKIITTSYMVGNSRSKAL